MIDGIRAEPQPKATGKCQVCDSVMIARCGEKKIWHWAHKSKQDCDQWWENETDWHREWKNHFPEEWQEIVGFDESGEKHIADLKTDHGLVVEFQHSYLKTEEIIKRTRFHFPMIWVVDGTRRETDLTHFENDLDFGSLVKLDWGGTVLSALRCYGSTRITKDWLPTGTMVALDFKTKDVFVLLNARPSGYVYLIYDRKLFIEEIKNGKFHMRLVQSPILKQVRN